MELGAFGFSSYADDQTVMAINQNLKMLLLTNQGEYVNKPTFGVGLTKFLFEMANPETESQVKQKISQQISKWMPYVIIHKIDFDYESVDTGAIGIGLRYSVNDGIKQEYVMIHTNI